MKLILEFLVWLGVRTRKFQTIDKSKNVLMLPNVYADGNLTWLIRIDLFQCAYGSMVFL